MDSFFSTNYYNIKSVWDTTRQILYVWLTPTPYILYNHATNIGNFGFAGIALGLIKAQNMFVISTIMGVCAIYFAKTAGLCYVSFFIGGICIYLYGLSISRIIDLMQYLNM